MTCSLRRRVAVCALGAAMLIAASVLPAAAATDPTKWGKTFCSSLEKWAKTFDEGATDLQSSVGSDTTPAQAKAVIVAFLGDATDTTSAFGDAVRAAGAPKVKNGAEIQSVIVEGIAGVEALLGSITTQAGQLPTTDATTFRTAAQPILTQLDGASAPFEDAMDEVGSIKGSKQLQKAMKKTKACKFLTG